VAFEEAAASQAAEASQAGSELVGDKDAADYDAVFGHEDAVFRGVQEVPRLPGAAQCFGGGVI